MSEAVCKPHKTIVLFRKWVEGLSARIEIDSMLTCEWSHTPDFLDAVESARALSMPADAVQQIMEMRFSEQPMTKEQEHMCRALQLMELRKRFNNDIVGPFIINSPHRPTDEEIKAWYIQRVT